MRAFLFHPTYWPTLERVEFSSGAAGGRGAGGARRPGSKQRVRRLGRPHGAHPAVTLGLGVALVHHLRGKTLLTVHSPQFTVHSPTVHWDVRRDHTIFRFRAGKPDHTLLTCTALSP
eukprot:9471485-Pyramimonas_sp.AAC.1